MALETDGWQPYEMVENSRNTPWGASGMCHDQGGASLFQGDLPSPINASPRCGSVAELFCCLLLRCQERRWGRGREVVVVDVGEEAAAEDLLAVVSLVWPCRTSPNLACCAHHLPDQRPSRKPR